MYVYFGSTLARTFAGNALIVATVVVMVVVIKRCGGDLSEVL